MIFWTAVHLEKLEIVQRIIESSDIIRKLVRKTMFDKSPAKKDLKAKGKGKIGERLSDQIEELEKELEDESHLLEYSPVKDNKNFYHDDTIRSNSPMMDQSYEQLHDRDKKRSGMLLNRHVSNLRDDELVRCQEDLLQIKELIMKKGYNINLNILKIALNKEEERLAR